MGSKGSNTTTQNQTSTYTPNGAVGGAGNMAINMAQTAASQPFNLPTAPVAGLTPDQLNAFQGYRNAQGMAQPYYNQAQGLFQQSANPITGSQINNYMNPYADYVLGNLKETQGQQMGDLTGRLTQAAGGVGADRIAVGQGELARQQNLATGQTLAGIYGSALGAAQQDAQRQQSAAYGIGNLGGAAQNASLQGSQALLSGGNQQQAQTQNELNAPYYNQLAQIAYPYQNAQFLAGITGGLAPALGGTTTGTKTTAGPSPSIFSQLLGAGTAAVGGIGASGGFGENGWLNNAFGAGPAYGNGNGEWGGSSANPLPGLSASDYGAGFAEGGGVTGPYENLGFFSGKGWDDLKDNPEKFLMNNLGLGITPWAKDLGKQMGFAEGGEVINPTQGDASWLSANPTIPKVDLKPPPVRPPELNWGDDKPAQQSNPMGDIANIAKMAMMFVNRGGRVGMAAGGSVYPGMGPNYAEGGETYDDGEGPFRLDPGAYGKWRDSTPTPQPDDIQPQDDRLPVNARPTAGTRPTRPYEFLSTGAADTAEANAKSMDRRSFEMPYDVNHRQDVSRNFAKDPWMALVAAGAGMMSGDSPFAGINIGKGLTSGVNYLGEQRKASREEEGVNQRARQLAMEAEKHRDSLTKMSPYQAAQIENQKKQREFQEGQLERQGWQKGETNILDGDTPWFNSVTKESGVLHSNGVFEIKSKGEGESATKPPGAVTPPVQSSPSAVAVPPVANAGAAAAPLGGQKPPEPAKPPPLGVPEFASNMEPNDALAGLGYIGKNSPITAASKKENDLTLAQQTKAAGQLPAFKQGLEEMRSAYRTLAKDVDKDGFISRLALQPGATFEKRLEAARAANAVKMAAGQPPPFSEEKLAAAETINKVQNRLGMAYSAQISPREAFAGQKIGIESTPGLTQSPQGFRRLLAGLEAAYDNAKDEQAFFQAYLKKNKGIALGWRQDFEAKNPAAKYVARSLLSDLPENHIKELPGDVERLRKNPTPENIKKFNDAYRDSANYFLKGQF